MNTASRTLEARPVALDPVSVEALRARVRGSVLQAGEPAYDEARSVWNAMIDRRPAAVIKALGVADILAAVSFAREQGVPISIKGGGHNIAGLAVCEGGVMLDLSLMRGVWVDRAARVARAQPGCLLGDVDRETQLHGLVALLGFVSNTGIAGLTLGGGFGYLSRLHGWTSDQVQALDVVTADGRLLRASEKEHPDLFWGLRGGGGNFGVVTGFEYRLFPLGPEIVGGVIAWGGERVEEVVEAFQRVSAQAPPELTCLLVLRIAPPAPWIAKEFHGRPMAALVVCHSGAVAEGERLVAPLKALGSPVGDVIQRRTYVSQQAILDATQPKGRRYYWKSEYLPRLDPAMLAKAVEHWRRIVSPHSAVILFPIGGALNRLPADHSAVGNRDAEWVVNVTASWEKPEEDAANIEWARNAWRDLRPFSTGGTYVNFLTEEETGDRIKAAYGGNYTRLIDVKTAWDPTNLFRSNKNIAPQA